MVIKCHKKSEKVRVQFSIAHLKEKSGSLTFEKLETFKKFKKKRKSKLISVD